jgi:hypothetical protein
LIPPSYATSIFPTPYNVTEKNIASTRTYNGTFKFESQFIEMQTHEKSTLGSYGCTVIPLGETRFYTYREFDLYREQVELLTPECIP